MSDSPKEQDEKNQLSPQRKVTINMEPEVMVDATRPPIKPASANNSSGSKRPPLRERSTSRSAPSQVARQRSTSAEKRAVKRQSVASSQQSSGSAEKAGRLRSRSKSLKKAIVKETPEEKHFRLITEEAIRSISPAAYSVANAPEKKKIALLIKEVSRAHRVGAEKIMHMWTEGQAQMENESAVGLFAPQQREIRRLVTFIEQLQQSSDQRVTHAHVIAETAIAGVENFLKEVQSSGAQLTEGTAALSLEPSPLVYGGVDPDLLGDMSNVGPDRASGTPKPEVRSRSALLPVPHPEALVVTEEQQHIASRIRRFFSADSAKRQALMSVEDLSSPNGGSVEASMIISPSTADVEAAFENQRRATAVQQEVEAKAVGELEQNLATMTSAVTALLTRLQIQHAEYESKLAAQQRALDEAATRLKVADDLLAGTVNQETVEATSAIAEVRDLGLLMRDRLRTVETETYDVLQELIDKTVESCADSNVYARQAALPQYKENMLSVFMSRSDRLAMTQSEVFREAQEMMLRLWQRCPSRPGAEEKGTLLSSNLPPPYQAQLNLCDRPTLLRLVGYLSRQTGSGAAAQIMGALDEYAVLLHRNPAEAAAAREQQARLNATEKLLERLDEEGRLDDRTAPGRSSSLSSRIEALVEQYGAYVDFNEQYARALARQADEQAHTAARKRGFPGASPSVLAQGPSQAFFSRTTPLPTNAGAGCGKGASLAAPHSSAAGSLPYLRIWNEARSGEKSKVSSPPATTASSVTSYMQRTNPSGPRITAAGPASVLGEGRWQGRAVALPDSTCAPSGSVLVPPTRPTTPPPPVPPRVGLVQHVVEHYSSAPASLLTDASAHVAASSQTGEAAGEKVCLGKADGKGVVYKYRDGDHVFIEQQRDLFKQLF